MNFFVYAFHKFATDQRCSSRAEEAAACLLPLLFRLPGARSGLQRRILEICWENQLSGVMGGVMGGAMGGTMGEAAPAGRGFRWSLMTGKLAGHVGDHRSVFTMDNATNQTHPCGFDVGREFQAH